MAARENFTTLSRLRFSHIYHENCTELENLNLSEYNKHHPFTRKVMRHSCTEAPLHVCFMKSIHAFIMAFVCLILCSGLNNSYSLYT